MSRWQPKKWARPRSKKARDDRDFRTWMLANGMDPDSPALASTMILKAYYPQQKVMSLVFGNGTGAYPILDKPEWAKTAQKFGWISQWRFLEIKEVNTGRVRKAVPHPLFALLPKPNKDSGLWRAT